MILAERIKRMRKERDRLLAKARTAKGEQVSRLIGRALGIDSDIAIFQRTYGRPR